MLQILYETISLAAAFGVGLYVFRYMSTFFRIMFLQLLIWIVFYILSYVVTMWQEAHQLPCDNQLLLNLHMLIETILLTTTAAVAFSSAWGKWLASAALGSFLTVFVWQGAPYGFSIYLNAADVTECIVISVLFALLLYRHFSNPGPIWWRSPEVLICLGILIYFACSVPYIAMMHYIERQYPGISVMLFQGISELLNNIRYLLTAIAFWFIRRNALLLKRAK